MFKREKLFIFLKDLLWQEARPKTRKVIIHSNRSLADQGYTFSMYVNKLLSTTVSELCRLILFSANCGGKVLGPQVPRAGQGRRTATQRAGGDLLKLHICKQVVPIFIRFCLEHGNFFNILNFAWTYPIEWTCQRHAYDGLIFFHSEGLGRFFIIACTFDNNFFFSWIN